MLESGITLEKLLAKSDDVCLITKQTRGDRKFLRAKAATAFSAS